MHSAQTSSHAEDMRSWLGELTQKLDRPHSVFDIYRRLAALQAADPAENRDERGARKRLREQVRQAREIHRSGGDICAVAGVQGEHLLCEIDDLRDREKQRGNTDRLRTLDLLERDVREKFAGDAPATESTEKPLAMTSANELQFLTEWAAAKYAGRGRIVDLGCWFGETSAALARGLRRNPAAGPQKPIHAYDLFIWYPWMDGIRDRLGRTLNYRQGDSFYETVLEMHRADLDLIDFRQTDLLGFDPGDEPIEFLFLDANKAWPLASSIYANFLPRLTPGQSVLVQQDYAWCDRLTAVNVMSMWLLRDHTTWLGHIPASCSVAFSIDRPLPSPVELRPDAFDSEEIEAAYAYAAQRLHAPHDGFFRFAKSLYYIQLGRATEAERAFEEAQASGAALRGQHRDSFEAELDKVADVPGMQTLGEQLSKALARVS